MIFISPMALQCLILMIGVSLFHKVNFIFFATICKFALPLILLSFFLSKNMFKYNESMFSNPMSNFSEWVLF